MTREELIEKMKKFEGTEVDFARIMNKSQSGIEEDIEHIRTSLRNNSEYLLMIKPATCLLCNYFFSNSKAKAPSKCPKCRGEKIQLPYFKIMRNKKFKN